MRFAVFVVFVVLGSLTLPARLVAQPKHYPPDLVAPTDPLSPADERKQFTIPPGFDVQLVASEPDIQKPMQMAFDAKGRLWVTTSYHYPFAAPAGKGTDKLFVLSDIDPVTGKAGKVEVFASDLNIPIGILPLPDCNSCIVSSTGEIRKYTDTDGDGKADKMEVLFTGFGFRDTHGMTNSFTLMPDGWVYACHGFANDSTVKGKDGHEVKMNSGHTFRFRPDGSRIEVYTRGQVNPFGIAVDPWFNLYTADCHSKPITQLIPGAYYDSFGKPHDGLGYGPHVTRHDHGSTGLCGLAWYDADQFPKDYLGCMFLGNVVTNRINFDKIEWKGSSPVAKELPDFLVSKDRWFRPVDIKLGPDGALYVADFYNKIIGHYEVDLKHPQRDKDRGRLWRIVWRGEPGSPATGFPPKFPFTDLTTATADELGQLAVRGNMTTKLLVAQQLRARIPEAAKARYPERTKEQALGELADAKHPKLQRAAAEYAILHPHAEFVAPLIELLKKTPADDTHLRQAARIALRNCLRDAGGWAIAEASVAEDTGNLKVLLPVVYGIRAKAGAAFLAMMLDNTRDGLKRFEKLGLSLDEAAEAAEFIGRWGAPAEQGKIITTDFVSVADHRAKLEPALRVSVALLRGVRAAGGKHIGTVPDDTRFLLEEALKPTTDPKLARLGVELYGLLLATAYDEMELKFLKQHHVSRFAAWMSQSSAPVELRVEAFEIAVTHFLDQLTEPIGKMLTDATGPAALREKVALTLAGNPRALEYVAVRDGIRDTMKNTSYRFASAVAAALASSKRGAELLLAAAKVNDVSPRILQERAILEKLRTHGIGDLDQQIAALTKGLPPLDQKLAELIKQRSVAFAAAKPDKELGAKLFTKHCAACHRIGDQGGKIAPQLDGIGIRGLERVLEDTLDPNRNVDQAFRARIITTTDDRTITGLMLRVEGEVLVLADAEGKEVRIPTKDIAANRETMLSPMPANFGEVIPEADFVHLLAYLLDQKAKQPSSK